MKTIFPDKTKKQDAKRLGMLLFLLSKLESTRQYNYTSNEELLPLNLQGSKTAYPPLSYNNKKENN